MAERRISTKPLEFGFGRPAVTPADPAPAAAPAPSPAPAPAQPAPQAADPEAAGLKGVVVYLEPSEAVALKVYAAMNNTSIQRLGIEALQDLFKKRGINNGVLTPVRANRKNGGFR